MEKTMTKANLVVVIGPGTLSAGPIIRDVIGKVSVIGETSFAPEKMDDYAEVEAVIARANRVVAVSINGFIDPVTEKNLKAAKLHNKKIYVIDYIREGVDFAVKSVRDCSKE